MEQASNVFNKGLQMDTHPMVQGNDTLTDALNGTFITMNGNEVILLNDMGNAKIDNAYLPSGFEPVGIKEYGGVIYVASYNPLTNKSQIGSFPSPERRIGNENTNLGGNLTLSVNTENADFKYTKENGIDFLQNDSVLISLTSDTSLHAGDKFTVYSSMIWNNKDKISNFENTVDEHKEEIKTKKEEVSRRIEAISTQIETVATQIETVATQIEETSIQIEETSTQIEEIKTNNPKDEEETPEAWEEGLNQIEGYTELNEEYAELNEKYIALSEEYTELNEKYIVLNKEREEREELNEEYEKLSNLSNKIYSPKNKLYTLQLGVLNSQNEFVDVTESLKRWDGKGTKTSSDSIKNTDKMSDLLAFNTGYFIANNFIPPTGSTGSTSDDKELILERQKIAANTYSYKLVGPLYLKATINHITSFNYAILGKKTGDSEAVVEVIANITYNCPDGGTFTKTADSDIYSTYELLDANTAKNLLWFDLFEVKEGKWESKSSEGDSVVNSISYNELTNTYSITVIKKYKVKGTNNIYDYYICPTLPDSSFPKDSSDSNINIPIYIKELSVEGSLDINRLGTGELSVSSWRFINNYDENSGLITYGFNAYPEYGHEFRNLTFWFRDIVKDYSPNESNTQNEASYAHGIDVGDLDGTWGEEETNGGTLDTGENIQGTLGEERDLGSGSIRDTTYTGTDDRVITIGGDESAVDDTGVISKTADITGWSHESVDEETGETTYHDIYYEAGSIEGEGTIVVKSYGDGSELLCESTINTTTTLEGTTLNNLISPTGEMSYIKFIGKEFVEKTKDDKLIYKSVYNLVDSFENKIGTMQWYTDKDNKLNIDVIYDSSNSTTPSEINPGTTNYSIKEIKEGKNPSGKDWLDYIKEKDSGWIKIPVESNIVPVNGTKELNWENYKLNPNTLYRVLITYDDVDINNNISEAKFIGDLSSDNPYWELYLTTNLLNDYADPTDEKFKKDFKNIEHVLAIPNKEHKLELKETLERFDENIKTKYYEIYKEGETPPENFELCRVGHGTLDYNIVFNPGFENSLYPKWLIFKTENVSNNTAFSIVENSTIENYKGNYKKEYTINPQIKEKTSNTVNFTYDLWAIGKAIKKDVQLNYELKSLADIIGKDRNTYYLKNKWIDFDSYDSHSKAFCAEYYTNKDTSKEYPIMSDKKTIFGVITPITGTDKKVYTLTDKDGTQYSWEKAFKAFNDVITSSDSYLRKLIAMGTPRDQFKKNIFSIVESEYKIPFGNFYITHRDYYRVDEEYTMVWFNVSYPFFNNKASQGDKWVFLTAIPYKSKEIDLNIHTLYLDIESYIKKYHRYYIGVPNDKSLKFWFIDNNRNNYKYLKDFSFLILGINTIEETYSTINNYNNDLLNITVNTAFSQDNPDTINIIYTTSEEYLVKSPIEYIFEIDIQNILNTDTIEILYLGDEHGDKHLDVSQVDTSNPEIIYENQVTYIHKPSERFGWSRDYSVSLKLVPLNDITLPYVSQFPTYLLGGEYIVNLFQAQHGVGTLEDDVVLSYLYVHSLKQTLNKYVKQTLDQNE